MNPTELILSNFQKISSIPRGTKYEAGIRNWLIEWAAEYNCASKTDAAGNLVIYFHATTVMKTAPPSSYQVTWTWSAENARAEA